VLFAQFAAISKGERSFLDNQEVTSSDTQIDTQTSVTCLHDVSQVVNAWPRLSVAFKTAILAIVNAAGK
jgi:hypothetical protein